MVRRHRLPRHQELVVLVIYLPQGNGADAARLAQHFFLAAKPSAAPATDSARSLTIELWTSRSVTHLTATPIGSTGKPLNVDWLHDGLQTAPGKTSKHLELTGNYSCKHRMRRKLPPPAAGPSAGSKIACACC